MITFLIILLALVSGIWLYMQTPKFGKDPSGERLERIKQSPHFKEGKFANLHFTPTLTEGYSMFGVLYDQFFKPKPNLKPNHSIPSTKTDLHSLDRSENILIWFGHSSYFIQLAGKRFLIDPVFSGSASPVPGSVKAFVGTDRYTVEDLPQIDYLLITHDHYDHLDYETIKAVTPKIDKVICGLGVGSHLEYWGYAASKITELDWSETIKLESTLTLHTAPTRHFSGRSFSRNNTLWVSYILETPQQKLYLGGDSGYDTHFKDIGERYGPFDLAILESGQYNLAWEAIHLLPPQTLVAATDLKAKRLFPVHSGKFVLSTHPWNEPLSEVYRINQEKYQLPLATPMIGEKLYLDNQNQIFTEWWKE
ncbi:MBL fold metallo-hydrolase [Thiofilum flexile]|uniref:MBL fold metallo-hydrolase n=1 Tax=Thiofilum flexile TaxID=125627 RepID=UPI000364959E|nr:MBL fold metallo-hydrolase [Thiofilum flexile]